jgi:type I restriction enzyme, R subunit
MSQFAFLQPEFPSIYEAADRGITNVHPDPRTACVYARRALELTVNWLYQYDDAAHPTADYPQIPCRSDD